jgi:glycosyltransferase 2 family protein
VERMFDLGATALIFSGALLLAPDRATLPYHEALQHAALGALALTIALAIFAISVRASGRAVASWAEKGLGSLSPALGHSAGTKILAFRDGLDSISTLGDFFLALGLSLLMWGFITAAYLETARAFVLSPELSSMTLARCMVLMVASMVGSIVQLPVVGWFTQIGVTTGVMQNIFHVQFEPALACGTMLLIVTFMSVIPFGLIWARVEHVSLKKVSEQSEQFSHEEAEPTPAISEA